MKFISLDAVLVEIDRLFNSHSSKHDIDEAGVVLLQLRENVEAIEAKEVDLDFTKEVDVWIRDNGDTNGFFNVEELAKHFFELGLKVQHDNWKVVDNINPPQADRNKIYCVFTKNRYILATVINHPKDEELLQWKCTEFPHHRYDMCEGDKYMQIV